VSLCFPAHTEVPWCRSDPGRRRSQYRHHGPPPPRPRRRPFRIRAHRAARYDLIDLGCQCLDSSSEEPSVSWIRFHHGDGETVRRIKTSTAWAATGSEDLAWGGPLRGIATATSGSRSKKIQWFACRPLRSPFEERSLGLGFHALGCAERSWDDPL